MNFNVEFTETNESFDAKMDGFVDLSKEYKEQIEDLDLQIAELQEEKETLQTQIDGLETDKAELQEQNAELVGNVDTLQGQITELETKKATLQNLLDTSIAQIEAELVVNADAVIEPVISGITERLVFKNTLPDVQYQVYAAETPFTSAPLDMNTHTVTANKGFEGDGIRVRFYADNEHISTMAIYVTNIIGGFKLCKLREV